MRLKTTDCRFAIVLFFTLVASPAFTLEPPAVVAAASVVVVVVRPEAVEAADRGLLRVQIVGRLKARYVGEVLSQVSGVGLNQDRSKTKIGSVNFIN